MRVLMGWVLFRGGVTKLVTYLDANPENNWTAAGYLANAIPEGNPFAGAFAAMAGNPLADVLVMWGLTLTGLGLVLGVLVRWNAFWGAVMVMLFWAAALEGGLFQGLPLAHGSPTTTSSTRPCCSASGPSARAASSAWTTASRRRASSSGTRGCATSSPERSRSQPVPSSLHSPR